MKGGYYGKQTCIIEVEKAVSPQRYISRWIDLAYNKDLV